MSRVVIKKDNKVAMFEGFPRLKLEHEEEVRIAFLELTEDEDTGEMLPAPEVVWVHALRRPKIVNGKPEMEWKKTKKGEDYETNVMDFLSLNVHTTTCPE